MKKLLARGRARGDMSDRQILFTLVFVNFVSISGFGMLLPVFAVYGEQIGASSMQIVWAIASFSLGQLLSGAIFGRLADRYGRRPLMIIGMLGSAVFYIGHAFAATPLLLMAMRFGAGIFSGSFAVSFAVGSDISTPATRSRVLGIVGAGFSFGFIFGPAIGGFAAGLVSETSAFVFISLFGAVLCFSAAAVTFFLLPETRRVRQTGSGMDTHRTRDLFRQKDFQVLLLVCLTGTVGMSMLHGVFVLFADHVLLLAPLGIGLMYTVMAFTGAVTQATAVGPVAERVGEHRMLIGAALIVCLGMLAVGSAGDVALALLGMAAVAVGYSLLNTATTSLASLVAVESLQGTALGLVQAVTSLGRFLGPAIAGPIYDIQGPPAPFYWAAVLMLLLGTVTTTWNPAVGRRPSRRTAK